MRLEVLPLPSLAALIRRKGRVYAPAECLSRNQGRPETFIIDTARAARRVRDNPGARLVALSG